MWITRVSIKNPVFATMVMVGIMVLGAFSYARLRVEQMPDVTLPYVDIETVYPGASPEVVETDVSKPIEEAVNTVSGVKRIYSNSRDGRSQVFVEFRLGTDITRAIQDARDKIALVRPTFPRDVKDPQVIRVQIEDNQPTVSLAVMSPTVDLRELTSLTDQTIVKVLENIPGVAQIDVNGRITRQILIQIKPTAMTSFGIGVDQVMSAVQNANQDVPAGRITRGHSDSIVRVEGKIKDPTQFGRIIVAQQGGGPVYLSQVADVIDGEKEPDSISRINGRPSITIDIRKAQDANIIETGRGVKDALESLKGRLPEDVEVRIVYSQADQVQRSLDRVKSTIIEGALLTVLIVFLFLHSWRSTIITGLTLPIAVIATFLALYAFGFTLNMMTLMALSLCIGLLIDDAIVVRENIVRHLSLGKTHVAAAREGTDEIGLAVMATTFAIVAVFVPIAFMKGIIGQFFFQFGLTVAVAVLVSLFVSFTLDPMLSSIWRDPPGSRFSRVPWLGRFMDRVESVVEWVHRVYGKMLEWAIAETHHRLYLPTFGVWTAVTTGDWRALKPRRATITNRGIVLWSAVLIFFGSFALLPFIGKEFSPQVDESFISLRLNTPVGTSLEFTDTKVQEVEKVLKQFPEIVLAMTTVGTQDGRNYARVNVRLTDRGARSRSQKDIETAIRTALKPVPGIELALGYDRPIWVNLLGPDPDTLKQLINEFADKVARVPGIADMETSEKALNPALSIRLNNDAAADLGISVQQVGATVRPLLAGETVSYWLGPDGQNYEVNVQLPREGRRLASDLGNLYISTNKRGPDGELRMVPLRQVAEIVESTSPQIIKRQDLQRRVALYANAEGRPSGNVGDDVKKIIDETKLPPGYRFAIAGQQEDTAESMTALVSALALAIIFIYLVLASQFASFTQPLAIMASLPFTLIGVLLALLLTDTTLNIFSMIGFVMLMGLVTKNAILLVDFANKSRRGGATLHDALTTAGQVRLRPILMTTAAMIFGMLPLALGLGESGETQAPMGRAIIGGVITSTLLTLVVVPVIYTYLDRFFEWHKARRAAREVRRATQANAPASGD
ncbi:MAG TPA: efflux RND transporter permease subunit [Casimicrobiaceae bacterium]|jgi:multidrug efflux pump subunit AcrB|nr:efflux RND transporter permease subunit [Casimicrobiaceae bacterium]